MEFSRKEEFLWIMDGLKYLLLLFLQTNCLFSS